MIRRVYFPGRHGDHVGSLARVDFGCPTTKDIEGGVVVLAETLASLAVGPQLNTRFRFSGSLCCLRAADLGVTRLDYGVDEIAPVQGVARASEQ